jgi:hypothetical protein
VQVGSLQMPSEFDAHFGTFYRMFSQQLVAILPPNTNLAQAYEAGTDEQQAFVQNLALFYTGFFKVCAVLQAGLSGMGLCFACTSLCCLWLKRALNPSTLHPQARHCCCSLL